jgi:hypothetical protein
MEFIKKNITLVIGIFIPILMIFLIAASIYLPGLFVQPKFNFIYSIGNHYYSRYIYSVQNGKLVRTERQPENEYYRLWGDIKLYVYDVAKNESKEISFEEAQNLNLDPNTKSPDGFEVVYGSRSSGFFPLFIWSERDYNTLYLKGRNMSKKINLQSSELYYRDFNFIGWIK